MTKELYAVNQTLESISQAKPPSPPFHWTPRGLTADARGRDQTAQPGRLRQGERTRVA